MSIGNLHLGPKAKLLEEAGFRTLGDLKDIDAVILMGIPSVGRRTAEAVVRLRVALREAILPDGEIDWPRYCATAGIPLIPASTPADGETFIQSLEPFFRTLAAAVDDDVCATILLDRICRPPDSQKTLEQIGATAVPPLTRERVRQKERKLLGQITGGLLNDRYDGLCIHFHPGFARWWRDAADALADADDIEVSSFVDLLASVWGISPDSVTSQLPSLVAVVTGEPQMAAGFRSYIRVDPRLFAECCHDLRETKVLKLRFGKAAVRLADGGLEDVGSVIELLRSGRLERVGGTTAKRAAEHLGLITSCIDTHGRVGWEAYRATLGLSCLPEAPPRSPAAFVATLAETVERLLSAHQVTLRAADIFRYRTGLDAESRMTLQQASEALGTYASTIKREETLFLAWLNDVLVSREFWMLEVWLDSAWLAYWAEAMEIFERSDNEYVRFVDNLAWGWRLTGREIRAAAPSLWAVFTGYPDGRPSRHRSAIPVSEDTSETGRIRLQGFRRTH